MNGKEFLDSLIQGGLGALKGEVFEEIHKRYEEVSERFGPIEILTVYFDKQQIGDRKFKLDGIEHRWDEFLPTVRWLIHLPRTHDDIRAGLTQWLLDHDMA